MPHDGRELTAAPQAVASLPATKPFFSHFLPNILGSASWTDVTEPLREKRKHSRKTSGASDLSFRDVEAADSPPQRLPAVRFALPPLTPSDSDAYSPRDPQPGFWYAPPTPPSAGTPVSSSALLSPPARRGDQ